MSGESLPLDLKKVLRDRMLSLLQGKTDSNGDTAITSTSENSSNSRSNGKSSALIQTAFSTFLDEKRKQITTENVNSSSSPSASVHLENARGNKITSKSETNSNPAVVDIPLANSEDYKQKTAESAPPCQSEISNQQKVELKEKVDTEGASGEGFSDKKSKKEEKLPRQTRTKTSSPSRKRPKNSSSHSLSSRHRKSDRSDSRDKHRSHSRDSHGRSNSDHHIKDKKNKKHKENKDRHSKKRSKNPTINFKDHSRRQKSDNSSSRKRKLLHDSFRSGGTIFDEMNVDPNELEKFMKGLLQKTTGPPTSGGTSSGGSSYTCTFKRHPSPPYRRPLSSSKKHHFDIVSYYSSSGGASLRERETTSKASTKPQSQNMTGTVHNSGKKTLKELTDFCRKIAEQPSHRKRHKSDGNNASDHDSDGSEMNEDGSLNRKKSAPIKMRIKDAKELKAKSAVEQLQAMYPVSTGLDHMSRERESSKLPPDPNFHRLIQRRLEAVKVLAENPNDYAALLTIEECDAKISSWATTPNGVLDSTLSIPPISVTQQPSTSTAAPLSVQGPQLPPLPYANVPPQAIPTAHLPWAHPDYLQMIARAKLDIGKKLLEKLGWREGLGLGKDLTGHKEPVLPDVKLDRKGLSSETEELIQRPLIAKAMAANGKHPVSMLQEMCSRNRWGAPNFEVTETLGPPHRQCFVMSVTLNGVTYRPTSACPTKKEAKALAATLCLQSLGLWRGGDASKAK